METKKAKLYVSLPITGYNLKERRETAVREGDRAAYELYKEGYTDVQVVNPFEVCNSYQLLEYNEYIGKDITALLDCTHMVLLQGWENSKGCRIEKAVAETIDIEIIEAGTL